MNMSTIDTLPAAGGENAGQAGLQAELERGIAVAQAGDKVSAYKLFQDIASRHADTAEVWVWLGGTANSLDEAEAAFQRAAMLDRSNEEAQLGLRWVALRKQLIATGRVEPAGADLAAVPYGDEFSTGVLSSHGTTALTSGSLTSGALPESAMRTGMLASGALGTGSLSTGPLKAEDADKSVKMKVGSASGRRLNIPPVAIFFFVFSFILYAIVIWLLWPK